MLIKINFLNTLFLIVLGICTTTLVSFSQNNDNPKVEDAAIAPATMPIARTVTDTKGRAMEGTILAKSDIAITFERVTDKKTFEIKIDTLSTDDVAFIATLVRKPLRMLVIGAKDEDSRIIEKHGCDTTWLKRDNKHGIKPDLGEISDEQLLGFDIIFQGPYESNQDRRLLAALEQFRGVALVRESRSSINRQMFLSGKYASTDKYSDEHFHTEGNFVFFNGNLQFETALKTAVELAEKNRNKRSSNPKTESGITKKSGLKMKRVLYIMEHALLKDRKIMNELEWDGYDITVAWNNEAKPLLGKVGNTTGLAVPSKRQLIRPEEATAKGFDAIWIGTTTILKDNREKMTWSKNYIDLMREANELGLVVMVSSLDDYSKKEILSGSPITTGDITVKSFVKIDENFIIYNTQNLYEMKRNPEDPAGEGRGDNDEKRRRVFNQKLNVTQSSR